MDLLEQPMEAVAFHLYSLPEVAAAGAAAWTCLAAVLAAAAAAGVWRLRSSTTADFTGAQKPSELDTSMSVMSSPELERSSDSTSSSPAPSPKERYTAYYQDSGCVGCCDVECEEEEEEELDSEDDDDGVYGPSETDPFPLEQEVVRPLVLLMPTATTDEMGRYRSPRALSGSVVQLWDQGAGRSLAVSPRLRGRAGNISIL